MHAFLALFKAKLSLPCLGKPQLKAFGPLSGGDPAWGAVNTVEPKLQDAGEATLPLVVSHPPYAPEMLKRSLRLAPTSVHSFSAHADS